MRTPIYVCATAALLIGVACHHDDYSRATTTTTGTTAASGGTVTAPVVSSENAVYRLTAARCQHELECKNVGAGKVYEDNGACERKLIKDLNAELRVSECPYGISEQRILVCLRNLQHDACTSPLRAVTEFSSCRNGSLCVR